MSTTTLPTTNGNHAQAAASETDKRILAELQRKQRVAELRERGWKVDLPSGKTATLIDPDDLTERRAQAFKKAMMRSARTNPVTGEREVDPEAAIEAGNVVVAAFLREWTFDLPLPAVGNFDSLLDITAKDYRILSDAVADVRPEAFPDYESPSDTDLTPAADKTSPFTNGSA